MKDTRFGSRNAEEFTLKNCVVFDTRDPASEEVTEADCFDAIPDCMSCGKYSTGKVAGVAARSRA